MRHFFFEEEMVKIWPKKLFFVSFCEVFFMPSYTLWITLQDFAKWKTLLRYIFLVSSVSIAYVVVKLKCFKVSCIDSASMKWLLFGFFGSYSPNYLFDPDEILTRGNSIRQTHCLKNSSKFWKFDSNGTHWKFMVLSILGPNILLEHQKFAWN